MDDKAEAEQKIAVNIIMFAENKRRNSPSGMYSERNPGGGGLEPEPRYGSYPPALARPLGLWSSDRQVLYMA